jgi:DNA-directed RNA polymerase subunit RPC12/RpoP
MGYGFELRCRNCDYSQNFFLGIGMMYHPLKNVINTENIKNKRLRNELIEISENKSLVWSSYSHELYRCEKCDKLYRKFYIELHYDGDKIFRTDYSCVKCRKPLKKINDLETENIPCPQCHKKKLYRDNEMLWD